MELTYKQMSTISSEELCKILGVANLITLDTTEGFPKSFRDSGKILFNKDEVAKYFNVEDLSEPFITLSEAAAYLGIGESKMHGLTFKNRVPSYRMKSAKGSGYLYKKSELKKIKDLQVDGNTDFINYFVGNAIIKDLFLSVVSEIHGDKHKKDYYIISKYLLDRMSMDQIGEQTGVCNERIRQILWKVVRRMRSKKFYSPKAYVELERQVAHQQAEIDLLNKLLTAKDNNPDGLYHSRIHINEIVEYLGKNLVDFDLPTRALNALHAVGLKTMYDLAVFCYSDDFKNLPKLKNLGHKAVFEIRDVLDECRKRLSSKTGLDLRELVKSKDNQGKLNLFREIQVKLNIVDSPCKS